MGIGRIIRDRDSSTLEIERALAAATDEIMNARYIAAADFSNLDAFGLSRNT